MLVFKDRDRRPVCLPREAVSSGRLSIYEIGLLACILSKPEEQELTEQGLAAEVGLDASLVAEMLSRLAECGHIGFGGVDLPAPTEAAPKPPQPTQEAPRQVAASSHRSRVKTASPPWLSREHLAEMAAMRREARRLSKETGVPHEVDHIVPLRGDAVCGLNVPWNLRVINGRLNLLKSNRFDVETNNTWSYRHGRSRAAKHGGINA